MEMFWWQIFRHYLEIRLIVCLLFKHFYMITSEIENLYYKCKLHKISRVRPSIRFLNPPPPPINFVHALLTIFNKISLHS